MTLLAALDAGTLYVGEAEGKVLACVKSQPYPAARILKNQVVK